MRGRRHLLGFLRRAAAASSSPAAHRVDPLCHLHQIPPRNGTAIPITTRFLSSRAGGSAGAAKSLIEDEADLSDWVSDLKTDSFHLGVSSGDEGEGSTRRPAASRGGRRGRDSGGPPPRSRFDGGDFGGERRGGEFSGERRGREFGGDRRGGRFGADTRGGGRFGGDRRGGRFGSDSRGGRFGGDRPGSERRGRVVSSDLSDDDEAGFGSSRGRRGRGGMSSGFSQRGGRGGDFGDDAGFRSPRGQRGRGGRGSGMSHRGGRYGDLDEEESGFGSPRGRRGRGGRESGLSRRGGRGSDFDDDEDDSGEEVGFGSRRGSRGRGGRMSGFSSRGGRKIDSDDDGEDEDDDGIEFEASGGKHNRGGRAEKRGSLGSRRGGKVGDVDFADRRSRGGKTFDFGSSESDSESGEVDEDDGPSGFEDDLSGDDGGEEVLVNRATKKSVSFQSVEGEPVDQESVMGTRGNGGGDSYLSQTR